VDKTALLFSRVLSLESLTRDLIVENGALNDQAKALAERASYLEGILAAQPQRQDYRVSEEEQEAEWQLKQGLIDTQEYEHLLKELDFQNANIELDPDYTPRQPTY
jgi:hypothetical protein